MLTDGRLYYGPRGEALKVFDVKDGYGIRRLLDIGVRIAIISGRDSPHVKQRARDLGIRYVYQGVSEKLPVFEKLRMRLGLEASECACVGDDRPDVPVMRTVGLAFAVFDAHPAALKAADMVTPNLGGRGAVRNICDLLVAARQHASRQLTRPAPKRPARKRKGAP